MINHEMAQADRARYGGLDLPPTQHVERIYRSVSVTVLRRTLDVVRTTLVELAAEMRAGTPRGESVPAPEVAEQAVQVAVHGKRNRVLINQAGPDSRTAGSVGGQSSVGEVELETPSRRVMWWLVAIATILGAAAAVWVLFL